MKTNRMVFVFIFCSSFIFGLLLFTVSQKVQIMERQKRTVEKSVENEKESIRVLKAEWHYLNRPDRLEEVLLNAGDDFQPAPKRSVNELLSDHEELLTPSDMPRPSTKPLFVRHRPAEKENAERLVKPSVDEKDFDTLLNDLEAANGE